MMKWSVPTVPDPCCKTLKRAWLGASNASRGRVLPGWWERGCYSKGSIYPFQESSNWFKFPKKKKDANRWYHGNSHEFVSKLKRLSNDFVLVQAGPCVYHQLTAPRMAGDLDDMRLLTTWDEKSRAFWEEVWELGVIARDRGVWRNSGPVGLVMSSENYPDLCCKITFEIFMWVLVWTSYSPQQFQEQMHSKICNFRRTYTPEN